MSAQVVFVIKAQHLIHPNINTEFVKIKFTVLIMKLHEHLFLLRHIAMRRGGIEKVLWIFDTQFLLNVLMLGRYLSFSILKLYVKFAEFAKLFCYQYL